MHKIVILGGGFGGVRTALDLNRKLKHRTDVSITLIDRNDGQTFYPSLYELAAIFGTSHEHPFHTKLRKLVSIPYGQIFKNTHVDFIQAEISNINIRQKFIATGGGTIIDFDHLVLALGAVASDFGIPGVKEYAHPFKTIDDALMLNDKLYNLMEEIAKGKRTPPIKVIVGGAGFTGIELASELVTCAEHIARQKKIDSKGCLSILLLEAGPMILPMVSEEERRLIRQRLDILGIQVMENTPITEIVSDAVVLKDKKRTLADIIAWTAGTAVPDIITGIYGLERDERGRVKVNDFLETNIENVLGLGDCVIIIDPKTGRPVPQMAYTAIEQGRIAAENIVRKITGRTLSTRRSGQGRAYAPEYGSWIAPVGGKYAVARVGQGRTYSGYLGYVLRQLVDLRYYVSVLPFFAGLGLFFRNVSQFSKND